MSKQRIQELEKILREASAAYYANGDSPLSDAEFDKQRDELEELDPQNAFLAEVGAPSDAALQKVKHRIPMGSLKKIDAATAVSQFNTWVTSQNAKHLKMSVQLKLDGVSVEIVYDKGKFVQAITRGNGDIGDDVTHTIKNAKGLPKTISVKSRVSVRCECLLYLDAWKKHFSEMRNPRNAAAGLVRRSNAKGSKHLSCIAFDVLFDDNGFKTEADRIAWLKAEGFESTPNRVLNANQVEAFVREVEAKRDTMPLEIDGAVIKLDDISEQESRGEHDGRPYWARAWKFKAMGGHTRILAVKWSVGTQGTITPVAKVAPVEVGGTTIQNVTLHNMDEIKRLGIQVGDTIEVVRAGDVIPQIIRVVEAGPRLAWSVITISECPVCGDGVHRKGPRVVCNQGANCVGAQVGKIKKWVKKRDIKFLGDSNMDKLIANDKIRSVADLYRLDVAHLLSAGIGEGMTKKILAQIDKSRTCSLPNLVGSLSLDMLGRSEASNLEAQGIDTLAKWKTLTAMQISKMPGYGSIKGIRIAKGVRANWDLIEELSGLLTVAAKPTPTSGKLSGNSFCFTGTMSNPRKDLEAKVTANGGEVRSVSKALTYLVIADPSSTSSKAVKARGQGVTLISEDDFLGMV